MDIKKIRNKQEFDEYNDNNNPVLLERMMVEQRLAIEGLKHKAWHIVGHCNGCNRASKFILDWNYSNGITPNYRERLICEHCGLNNRQRFMLGYLKTLINRKTSISTVYCYEQITNFYQLLKAQLLASTDVFGSEYLGYNIPSGETVNSIRHEDAMNLSFDDNSLDIVISNDVFEHVPDIQKTVQELYRVLKPGGKALISIPFNVESDATIQRAKIENGVLIHLLPEQYHGNPISAKGSLVFYDYSWNFLDYFINNSFQDAYALFYYSYFYGNLGKNQLLFVAEK